ncbi:hypothetical protein U1Q18_014490 [Sarracenia purpurea var. burkii]
MGVDVRRRSQIRFLYPKGMSRTRFRKSLKLRSERKPKRRIWPIGPVLRFFEICSKAQLPVIEQAILGEVGEDHIGNVECKSVVSKEISGVGLALENQPVSAEIVVFPGECDVNP